jgi:glycosyltransferase involved in cell wall biosynthesis
VAEANPPKLRLGLDGGVFENRNQRGIQRYFREIVLRLRARVEFSLVLYGEPAVPLPDVHHVLRIGSTAVRRHWRGVGRALSILHRLLLRPTLLRLDVLQTSHYRRPAVGGVPEVVTVYDMCIADNPELLGGPLRSRFLPLQAAAIRRASRIVCISGATGVALTRHFPEAASKTRVIYPGADHLDIPESDRPLLAGLPRNYALFVGGRHEYKNFGTVAQAMKTPGWPQGLSLVVAGPEFTAMEAARVEAMGLGGSIARLDDASDGALAALYRNAACFVFPSFCEGFGFPLLEAQRAGTPTACSRIPVFTEVSGAASEYFDPRDAGDLAAAVARAVTEPRAAALREAGQMNAARFSWDRCASEVLAVYRELQQPR